VKKKPTLKPGDMVQVLDEVVDGQTDVGVVMAKPMHWPLVKSHTLGRRAKLHPVLVGGQRHWIDERNLRLIESSDG
jgi:hypothetical protein